MTSLATSETVHHGSVMLTRCYYAVVIALGLQMCVSAGLNFRLSDDSASLTVAHRRLHPQRN